MNSYDNDEMHTSISQINNKRLKRELEFHILGKYRDKKIYQDVEDSIVIDFSQNFVDFLILTTTKMVKVRIKIYDGYPWRKPIVYLNDKPYDSILHVPNKFLKNIGIHYECMCCQSILCDWNPMRKLHHILDEVAHNLEIRTRVVNYILCEKWLKNIFDNDAFDDVQKYILRFI